MRGSAEMQSKVSMVIPCYNKERFISGMFESILNQEWDNIELILVNDGSTDRTFSIINEYEPRFISRGYEVLIIDQDNQGVSAAVRNGLLRVSGEYVCQVDADDELDPCYVSEMAKWLDKNHDYDWTACDATIENDDSVHYVNTMNYENDTPLAAIEKWILQKGGRAIWVHMIRMEYLRRCNVIELFFIGREGNQEAQFFLPLALGGGKIKLINEPLYRFNSRDHSSHRSYSNSYSELKERNDGIITAFTHIIQRMPIKSCDKKRLCVIAELKHHALVVKIALSSKYKSEDLFDSVDILQETVWKYFAPHNLINSNRVFLFPQLYCDALEDNLCGSLPIDVDIPTGRVIAWGVLGKNADRLLPHLDGTPLEPNELWDVRCNGNTIKYPDVSSLTEQDVVLLLPSKENVLKEIKKTLDGIECLILPHEHISMYVRKKLFPEFYDGTIKFTIESDL